MVRWSIEDLRDDTMHVYEKHGRIIEPLQIFCMVLAVSAIRIKTAYGIDITDQAKIMLKHISEEITEKEVN